MDSAPGLIWSLFRLTSAGQSINLPTFFLSWDNMTREGAFSPNYIWYPDLYSSTHKCSSSTQPFSKILCSTWPPEASVHGQSRTLMRLHKPPTLCPPWIFPMLFRSPGSLVCISEYIREPARGPDRSISKNHISTEKEQHNWKFKKWYHLQGNKKITNLRTNQTKVCKDFILKYFKNYWCLK